MYYTLIVDDEPLMRTYLANTISAVCPRFTVTGIAGNGREAMDWLKRQHFDLVITDIRMPEMDGLSLAKYIDEVFPCTRVAVISGYSEFEYARSALKYHVTDYLLKPLNDNALREVLQNAGEQLDHFQSAVPSMDGQELPGLGSLFLRAVLEESPGQLLSLYDALEEKGFSFENKICAILLLSIDELDLLLTHTNTADVLTWQFKLMKLVLEYCRKQAFLTANGTGGNVYILLQADSEAKLFPLADQVYRTLTRQAQTLGFPRLLAACGSHTTDIIELPLSAQTAVDSLSLSLLRLPAPYFYCTYQENRGFLEKANDACDKIYQDYLTLSGEQLYLDISAFLALNEEPPALAGLLLYGTHLLRYISSRSHIKVHYRKAAYQSLMDSADSLISFNGLTIDQMTKAVHSSVLSLISQKQPVQSSGSGQIAENARRYILAHYSEQISLTKIAEEIGVNSCYLSDIFHKYLGESYSRYLLRIRMEQAARLLKENPDEKIYKIASDTGFVSPKHFISVFKKYYGMTPAVYAVDFTSCIAFSP